MLLGWPQELLVFVKHLLNRVGQLGSDDVLDEFVLRVQNNVTQFAEVLDNNLGVVTFHEKELTGEGDEYLVVVDELVQQWVQDS